MPSHPDRSHQHEPATQHRLFVAVLLPPKWIAALTDAQQALRDAGLRLRYARPEGIHLTLHFLGATPGARIDTLDGALRRAAAAARPFELRLGAPGTFGTPRRPRVVWIGVHDAEGALHALQRTIGDELRAAAFPAEERSFRPHLTLARVPEGSGSTDAEQLATVVTELRPRAVEPIEGRQFALIESHLGPSGARYEQRAVYALTAEHDQPGGYR